MPEEQVGESEPLFTVGENANWCSHSENQYGESTKVKLKFTIWPYSNTTWQMLKTLIAHSRDTWAAVFTAALFTIARERKQPKCPPANKWIMKMWYMTEYYLFVKKKWNHEICRQTDGTRKDHVAWDNPDSERQAPHILSRLWSLAPGLHSCVSM